MSWDGTRGRLARGGSANGVRIKVLASLLATSGFAVVSSAAQAQASYPPSSQSSSAPTAEGVPPPTTDQASSVVGRTTSPEPETVAEAERAQVENIVVTASRYQQTLQRTPLAVSALGANALEQRGITQVENLSTEVPNLQIGTNGANSSVDLSIRGITSPNTNTYSGNPAVATYVNGVYVPRTQGLNASLFDVERVEVLRGPQGTLYGRNATAGAINIITARPTQDFDFGADLTLGNYDTVTSRAMVNVPVTDTLAIRGTAFFNRNDGYQDTLGTTEDNYFRDKQHGARLSALWKPGANLSVLLQGDYFRDLGSPNLGIATPVPGTFYPTSQNSDPYRTPVTPGQNGSQDIEVFNIRANIDYSFSDTFSASYIGGYGTVKVETFTDDDGLPLAYASARFDDQEWNTSHEVVARYIDDSLQAVVGANYSEERTEGSLAVEFFQATGRAPQQLQFPHPDYRQNSFGVFGQATYSFSEAFRVTGGLRYSRDKASNDGAGTLFCLRATPLFVPTNSPQCNRFSPSNMAPRTYENVSWRAGVEYDLAPTSLLYGTVSTGYKQGALNAVSTLITSPVVRPEKVINYEIGSKNRLFGGSVTANVALFYMDYTDLQVNQVVFVSPGVTTNFTNNAAQASIYGAELEMAWQISSNDLISGFASYLHARYDSFPNSIDPIVDPGNLNLLDLSGNRLIRSPDFSARINYSHRFDMAGGGSLTPQVSFFYQTESFLREFNKPFDRQPGYTRTDLRLTYELPGDNWVAEAFVLNLENKAVRVAEYPAGSVLNSYYAPPRRFGVRIAYKY